MTQADFHPGERAVQRRAGITRRAPKSGPQFKREIPAPAAEFLHELDALYLAARDEAGRVWASPLLGKRGFAKVTGESQVQLAAGLPAVDPLSSPCRAGCLVGGLGIDFPSRRRMRLNGRLTQQESGSVMEMDQVFGNCPKFIHPWTFVEGREQRSRRLLSAETTLSADQARWLAEARTFVIGTTDADGHADASHRGGEPGFLTVASAQTLSWPDYAGNNMFCTLGNIHLNPRAGLLFWDARGERFLQLTGRVEIDWDSAAVRAVPDAQRLIHYHIEQVLETELA